MGTASSAPSAGELLTDARRTQLDANARLILKEVLGCDFGPEDLRGWAHSLCPGHEEKTPSFGVGRDGACRCQGCGLKGDVIKVIHTVRRCSFAQARDLALEAIGSDGAVPVRVKPAKSTKAADLGDLVVPVPENAPTFSAPIDALAVYTWRDAGGALVAHTVRQPHPNRGKTVKPWTLRRKGSHMVWRSTDAGLTPPLYNAANIAARPEDVILFVEGEKAADAATQSLPEFVATTFMGSAGIDRTDWSAVAGRRVVVWPDADDTGLKKAQAAEQKIVQHGGSTFVVKLPVDLPNGWDLADIDVPENHEKYSAEMTVDRVREIIAKTLAQPMLSVRSTNRAVDHDVPTPSETRDEPKDLAPLSTASVTLDGLIERVATDPGAPFVPDTLQCLVALKKNDAAAFETLRAQLKRAGCRVTELDKAIAEENGAPGGRGPKQADILIELAAEAELFHSPDDTGYADLEMDGHRETRSIRSKGFRRWLARRFFQTTQGAPNSEALQSALNVIEANAHFDAPQREVHVRVGALDDRLYLDLSDDAWRAVEIDTDGWRVIDNPPVRFRRAAGMQPLPQPTPGGSVEALRPFLNLRSDPDFVLVVAWALAVLRNRGPYPVLVLSGEQGSAKSTFSAILRSLLDPNTAPLRALPREDRDLFIAANNSHVLTFDNVSGLPTWISDTICRLATGGGFAVRQLYTDQDEVLFDATRPIVLNGIEEIVTRPDLADRALFLTLEPIPDERRRPEKELWSAFETERPCILGGLLDAMVRGLRMMPQTRLEEPPRMADFALWATACETALWPDGTFCAAYCGNRDEAIEGVIEADQIATALRTFMETRTVWSGTSTELLGALGDQAGDGAKKSKGWPNSPRGLAGRLRRAATFLRKVGVEIDFRREGRARTRVIHITRSAESAGVQSSAPSASGPNPSDSSDFRFEPVRTVLIDANGRADHGGTDPVTTGLAKPAKNHSRADADDADANAGHQSGALVDRTATGDSRL